MFFIPLVLLILLVCCLYIFFAYNIFALKSGAPYVPTSSANIRRMLSLADLQPGEKIIDIGSGDGRIVFAAARRQAICLGIEINPLLVWWSRCISYIQKHHKLITITQQNFWQVDMSEADVIIAYCIGSKMPVLQQKLAKEAKAGARIISSRFQFPDWQYSKKDGTVYLYIVPS